MVYRASVDNPCNETQEESMTEDDYLERLSQVEFDLAFLKKRIRNLDFNIAVADMEGNTLEYNKLKR